MCKHRASIEVRKDVVPTFSAKRTLNSKCYLFVCKNPDLTITISRSDLEQVMMGKKTLEAQIVDGTAKIAGDASVLQKLVATIVEFDPRFKISSGTKPTAETEPVDPYEAVPRQTIAE
ncbi:MAG TPA: alkyl sulfatase C-terminal domain-containing protein [Chthoniobacterales bacterium]|jgi:ubiquinone biosynthesis protein UbiJ|nr:alkyl sulfatase C-terminal domain-containing protein [Chthoniobacterales bacterium]